MTEVAQIKKEARPITKKVMANWFTIVKLSGPPRQIIPRNRVAQRNIIVKNNRSAIYCIFFMVSTAGVAPATSSL